MRRIISFLALPFVAIAMLVVPLFGGHFCAQEAIPLLGGATALPFLDPIVRRLTARLRRRPAHCCDEKHSSLPVKVTTVRCEDCEDYRVHGARACPIHGGP